ncbi:hypothetical protein MLD38_021892 [Melastoma candidum]|uniref:Uncharacterized protein n=1 Tax=Melastoma candidum TaxID=119954 RepID=A0ACB9QIF6_9MYRT|nr:hypothetical protein MLD38_021892 [Melastoma candidum]
MGALTYPCCGHVIPMLALCKVLASKSSRLLITFVVTEGLSLLDRGIHVPGNLIFATIPNFIPSEFSHGKDFLGFFEAVLTKVLAPFKRLLDGCPTISLILVDTVVYWVVDIGRVRNVPVASFWS